MRVTMKPVLGLGVACAILLVLANSALAQNFAGQPINLVVNFSAGGPTDIEARIIAQHLPKYLHGVDAVVVRNVGGAGGTIGVNQLGEASGRDRLSLGFFTWDPMTQILSDPVLRIRFNDLKFIAGMRQTNLLYIRRDTSPGIVKPADVAKAKLFRAGALSAGNWSTLRQRLALDLLGAKYETIAAYKGVRDVDMAIMQGDIQLMSNSLPGYFAFTKPNLVDKGIVIPLLQYDRADGLPGRSPDLPDVPTFLEVYKDVWGREAAPGGEKWQALQLLTRIMDRMTRTIFMPPSAPEPAVAEMRGAMEKLAKDPQFNAQYEKVALTQPRFIVGAEGERIIAELGNVSPSMVTFFRQYIKAGQ